MIAKIKEQIVRYRRGQRLGFAGAIDDKINDTIERCAQVDVASEERFNVRADTPYTDGYWHGVQDKEAAIRALKDKL